MAARVRLKLARIQPHVTGASIHFILQAARPLLDSLHDSPWAREGLKMQRADRAAQILAAESDGCTSAAETGTDTTTRHRRINPLHFTSRKTPTRSPSTIHPRREKGSKCSGPIERRKFWRQRAMAARVRPKLARIQPHVTGASIHFILQAARALLGLPHFHCSRPLH